MLVGETQMPHLIVGRVELVYVSPGSTTNLNTSWTGGSGEPCRHTAGLAGRRVCVCVWELV